MMARSRGPGPLSAYQAAAGLPPWWNYMVVNRDGAPKSIALNADVALSQDPAFAGAIRLDRLRGQTMLCAPVPWDQNALVPRPWQDSDDYQAMLWLQENMVIVSLNITHEVINGIAARNAYHPIIDYFERLGGTSITTSIWDRIPRLGDPTNYSNSAGVSWLTYYLGARDSEYIRAVGSRWAISAVARIFEPGCQADCALILEGATGIGKSSTFKILGSPWYTNNIAALNTKDAQEQLVGIWIVELDELDTVNRSSEWSSVVSFISRSVDRFRFSYGHRVQEFKRQCVFGGTTERDDWLPKLDGRRRFWPARCGQDIDLDALTADRDQLWAEALVRYGLGERWHLYEDDLIEAAVREQEDRSPPDVWTDIIMAFCKGKHYVTTTDVLLNALGFPKDRLKNQDQTRVAGVLRRHGWKRDQQRVPDENGIPKPTKIFVNPEFAHLFGE